MVFAGLEDFALLVDAAIRERTPGAAGGGEDTLRVDVAGEEAAEDVVRVRGLVPFSGSATPGKAPSKSAGSLIRAIEIWRAFCIAAFIWALRIEAFTPERSPPRAPR